MCRSVDAGGRRCPCARGARRRAAQRARYAARRSEAAVAAANGGVVPGGAVLPTGPVGELLAAADADPFALTAEQRQEVLAYSRERAEATRGAVGDEWEKAKDASGGQWVKDGAAAAYEAAIREHGQHLSRAVAMNAVNRIEAAGADEAALIAAGAFASDASFEERQAAVEAARKVHRTAWRQAMVEEMPHRRFGNVAADASFGTGMTKARQAEFAELVACYPDGMVSDSNNAGLVMTVRMSKRRAHFAAAMKVNVKESVPVYTDAYDILSAIQHKTPSESVEDAVGRSLAWAGSSWAKDGEPEWSNGVSATPENREALEKAVHAWSSSPSLRKRFGSRPEIVESENGARLFLRSGKKKSITTKSVARAELTTNGSDSTTVHELAHRMESNNRQIGAACRAFHARRTQGLSPTLYAKTGKKVEMATEDSFVDHYVGKDYPTSANHTEVFSMGMESVAAGVFGGLTGHRRTVTLHGVQQWEGKVDAEHEHLILGLLSTASADKD